MSYMEKRIESRPTSGEAPFVLGETFYSRTDKRGIILAGNEVFRRVSAYSWDELINAPHKTIRHPDMPKGIFWLFWDTLSKGEPIGAYVKNQAKDGLHYWVFAIALPTSEGYISLRIKPSSPVFTQISEIYADMHANERADGVSPEQSSRALIATLKEQGFTDYNSFATYALAEELLSMDRSIERARDRSVTTFKSIAASVAKLQGFMEELTEQFEAIGSIPTNMRLHASRLEPAGGSLTALSENYWKMANDMTTWFHGFTTNSDNAFTSIEIAINNAMLNKCAERLLEKSHNDLERERRKTEQFIIADEKSRLKRLKTEYSGNALTGLRLIEQKSQHIANAISILKRHISGLSTTRIMCKIEAANLPSGAEALSGIISDFGRFQDAIERSLEQINRHNIVVQSQARSLIPRESSRN